MRVKGGLPPDHVVEDEAFILKDSQRLIEQYHDPKPGAMIQIVLAPCSPFSVTPEFNAFKCMHWHASMVFTCTPIWLKLRMKKYFASEKFGLRPVALMGEIELDWS